MSTIAYALRADFAGTVERVLSTDAAGEPVDVETVPRFLGGIVSIDDARDLDVAAALEEGNGRIVVDDSDLMAINVLDAYPALKRVGAEDDDRLTVDRYADANVRELDRELRLRGITGLDTAKPAKVAALHADDARQAAGIPVPDTYTVEALADTATQEA